MLASVVGLACDRAEPPAQAELLVVTADSTYWVTASRGAVRARGVPMLVARVDGRFTELYVADDDRSYYDAVFVGHRLFARDLVRGDSVELHRDTLVLRLADEYSRAHPEEVPLAPDEPENDNAGIRATSDLEILTVTGPYVSYEHHTDVDSRDDLAVRHEHQYRRGVLDARTGTPQSLASLFGRSVADSAIAAGRREWRATRDTILAVAGAQGGRTGAALSAFDFDPYSFTLGAVGQTPTIRFAIPASGTNPDIEPVVLRPRSVAAPAWWAGAASEFQMEAGADGRWVYRDDTLSSHAEPGVPGWTVTLAVGGGPAQMALRASSAIERVMWLDSTVNVDDRAALQRAFAEAGDYDGGRQVADATFGPLALRAASLHLQSHERNSAGPHRTRVAARVVGADDAAGREHARARVRRGDPRHARQDGGRMRDATRAVAVRHRIG